MPYGRMRMKTTKINPRSPYGRLLLEKQEVERLCESWPGNWRARCYSAGRQAPDGS